MDLLVHPVNVVGHKVVHVHSPGLTVAQPAPRHHHDFPRKIITCRGQRLLQIRKRRYDHRLTDVLRLLHTFHRVFRHRSLAVGVPEDRLQGAEYVDLVSPADPVGLQFVEEALHRDRHDGVQLPRADSGNYVDIDGAVDVLSVE
ncbi:hypothetical protein [Streptomyces hokutonensis]|uniref:Uncharacterized protein n=1 Tax=Streptomyces hokutonensis TaxID=1306990 RepID=A0ABW6M1P8_9ACTN